MNYSYDFRLICSYDSDLLQATLKTRQMDMVSVQEENDTGNAVQVAHDFRKRLHILPRLENL